MTDIAEPLITRDGLGTLPHSIEAEQSVLGGLLIGTARHVDEVSLLLRAEDFYRPAHQIIYSAIVHLSGQGEPADAVTVLDELQRRGELARVGGAEYLHTLTAVVPTAANVGYYARIVRGHARMRALVEVGTRVAEYGYRGDPDQADEVIGRALDELTERDAPPESAPTAPDVLLEVMDWLERGDQGQRVPLPYVDLQALLGGLTPGQLVVVGARPAVGKSVVASDVARHAALRHGMPVYLASLEMSRHEVAMRIMAAEGRVPLTRLRDRTLSDQEWGRVARVSSTLASAPHLVLDDRPHITVDHLRAELRRMARREHGPARLVVVDYLQLMRTPSAGRRTPENRQVEVAELARGLKLLAKEFEVPVLCLSQLNRGVEQRADKRPVLADLRESGAIEQDADVVILLHRDDEERPGEIDLIVAKHRNGPTGTVRCAFQGHYARVADMAQMAQADD